MESSREEMGIADLAMVHHRLGKRGNHDGLLLLLPPLELSPSPRLQLPVLLAERAVPAAEMKDAIGSMVWLDPKPRLQLGPVGARIDPPHACELLQSIPDDARRGARRSVHHHHRRRSIVASICTTISITGISITGIGIGLI
jgi:hypothetical protein